MDDIYMLITTNSHSKILELQKHEQALALYIFYHKQAKIQKTNQPFVTINLCMKELHWGRNKVMSAKSGLREIGLIEDFRPTIGSKTYVKLNEQEAEKP